MTQADGGQSIPFRFSLSGVASSPLAGAAWHATTHSALVRFTR